MFRVWYLDFGGRIFPFTDLVVTKDQNPSQPATRHVPFIFYWAWLPQTKYPAMASPSIESYQHGLVKAQDPPGDNLLHVGIPLSNQQQLFNLPKHIMEGGRPHTNEYEAWRDSLELLVDHGPYSCGLWMLLWSQNSLNAHP